MVELERNWAFKPSSPSIITRLGRVRKNLLKKCAFPDWSVIREPERESRWIVYFLYSVTNEISPAHHYTLAKLAEENVKILVVATGLNDTERSRLPEMADAVVVKDCDGYDFSAYAIALELLVHHSPGADIFFLNDSVLGPFVELEHLIWEAPWDFTGMLASAECENHIQSFAFSIKNCTAQRIRALHPLFTLDNAFNVFGDVLSLKETQMARIASRSMSVGARWYSPPDFARNASMQRPFDLIAAGFPFLKRANLEKHASLHDQSQLRAFLKDNGHSPL